MTWTAKFEASGVAVCEHHIDVDDGGDVVVVVTVTASIPQVFQPLRGSPLANISIYDLPGCMRSIIS